MGQVTLNLPGDLPDPIDLPPVDHSNAATLSAAALASADDLLSQLAGEDIDRLLAEAENAGSLPSAPAPPSNASMDSIEAQPEPVQPPGASIEPAIVPQKPVAEAAAPEAVVAEARTPVAETPVERQEAAALQAMIEPAPAAPAVIEPPPVTVAVPPEIPLLIETTTAAEIAALLEPTADSDESDVIDNLGAHAARVARGPSVIVRVLQLINRPMSWISDAVRDALGKVALLTLFNAVAVLVYVLVFRRHGR